MSEYISERDLSSIGETNMAAYAGLTVTDGGICLQRTELPQTVTQAGALASDINIKSSKANETAVTAAEYVYGPIPDDVPDYYKNVTIDPDFAELLKDVKVTAIREDKTAAEYVYGPIPEKNETISSSEKSSLTIIVNPSPLVINFPNIQSVIDAYGNKGFIYGYENVSSASFGISPYYLGYANQNELYIDAEKTAVDSTLCWAATAANTLYYTGWLTSNLKNEDDVFNVFRNSFVQVGGGKTHYGYEWFLNGSYSAEAGNDQVISSGGFFSSAIDSSSFYSFNSECIGNSNVIQSMVDELKKGNGVAIGYGVYDSLGNRQYGHAVTLWGYTCNTSVSSGSCDYYKGIVVTDSDDNIVSSGTDPKAACDTLKILDLKWDSATERYKILTNALPESSFGYRSIEYYSVVSRAFFTTLSSQNLVFSHGATLLGKSVESGYTINVSSAGLAMDTIVSSGGTMNVHANGTALDTIVSGGTMNIFSGGTALFYSGCQADNIQASNGAFLGLTVAPSTYLNGSYGLNQFEVSSNSISGYTVHSGCMLDVLSGGTATDITAENGAILGLTVASNTSAHVSYGGIVFDMSNAEISDYTVYSTWRLDVLSGGTATDITAENGARLGLTVAPDTYASGLYGGTQFEMSSASISNYTVHSGCWLDIYSGGSASNINMLGAKANIQSGGLMTILSGATISGTIELAGTVQALGSAVASGATVNYLVKDRTTSDSVMLNNLGNLTSVSCKITVSGNESFGSYSLANGAPDNYSEYVPIYKMSDQIGALSVGGGIVSTSYKLYSLKETNNNVLYLDVAEKPIKSDIDYNRISDVMMIQRTSVVTNDQKQDYISIGFWKNGTNTWHGTGINHAIDDGNDSTNPNWVALGAYDMNSNGKADSVLVGNVEINGIKGAYVGYYTDSEDYDSNWVNISYLTNNAGYVWKNKVGNLTGNAGMNSIVWHCATLGALGVWTDGTDNWISLGTGYNSNWKLIGCGDFDGDGKDSVLMSYNDGQMFYAVGIDGAAQALGGLNWTGWDVRTIGDFDGDGKDDIILFKNGTGEVKRIINGNGNSVTLGYLNSESVVGCGDYDNDCKDDLLVQTSTGTLGYYSEGVLDTDHWHSMGSGVNGWEIIA